MTGYIVAVMILGAMAIQDGVASICFYERRGKETWKRNHSWRLVRVGAGVALVIIGAKLLGV